MTALQRLLGIQAPIIQAPMAGVQESALAVAVGEAGGLGSLPCGMLSPDALREELVTLRSRTARPVNLNFFCHSMPSPDPVRDAAWRRTLAPYYREFGLDDHPQAAAASRMPFDAVTAELLRAFEPPIVSFHFGLPDPELLARVRSWGAKVLATATTVAEARWLQAHGADAIIAQGLEAGGHRGFFLGDDPSTQIGTFALLPQIVHAVDVPVIAAGGIADAAGVAAALALGAQAVQAGTAYLLCPEASTSAVHRAALQGDSARHTALTRLFSGGAARGIVNRLMRDLGSMNTVAPAFPLASTAIAPLRAAAESMGRGDFSPLWAGQNTSGCRTVPAARLTRELAGL